MDNADLHRMVSILDERKATLSDHELYYSGTQPLAFTSAQARDATKLSRMVSNIPRLAVTALAERLRITGLSGSEALWSDWLANDLDQHAGTVHREALALGTAYAIVWGDGRGGPQVSVESAHQVAVEHDPGTRRVLRAVKVWESGNETHAVLFEPDQITRYKADRAGATMGFTAISTTTNPFGIVPVVEFANSDRLLTPGVSEMEDLKPLVDALNKVLADMMVGSEFYARPRRWATGVELMEDDEGNPINPFPEGDRMMIAEEAAASFGSLPAADLNSYEAAVRVLLGQIMAVSALPAHYIGITSNNPASAEALRAAEASLAARAAARQAQFGRAWEQVAQLMVAARTGVDPLAVTARVTWADPGTRSVAQEADAIVKLHAERLLPTDYALARLGYADDEIKEIRAAREREAVERAVEALA